MPLYTLFHSVQTRTSYFEFCCAQINVETNQLLDCSLFQILKPMNVQMFFYLLSEENFRTFVALKNYFRGQQFSKIFGNVQKFPEFFWTRKKKLFFSELRNFLGYSFDVKIYNLSIYDVFRAFWALLPCVINQLAVSRRVMPVLVTAVVPLRQLLCGKPCNQLSRHIFFMILRELDSGWQESPKYF